MTPPTPEQAWEFVLMLKAGLPASEAIRYFPVFEDHDDATYVKQLAEKWLKSPAVNRAQVRLYSKRWVDLSLEEMMKLSLDKTYAEMSYMLFTRNYAELSAGDKAKADTARVTLEAKIAGKSGEQPPLEKFLADWKAQKEAERKKDSQGVVEPEATTTH